MLESRQTAAYRLPHDTENAHRCGYCVSFKQTHCSRVEGWPAFWATCRYWEGAPRGRHLARPYVRKQTATIPPALKLRRAGRKRGKGTP